MATERISRVPKQYHLTTFYGGVDRGKCIQLTGVTHYVEHPLTNQIVNCGRYTELSKDQAKLLIKDLQDFIEDDLTVKEE